MGILNQVGGAIGQAFAPPPTAAGEAGASLGTGTLATGMDMTGAILQGVGGYQQAQYQSKLAAANAVNTTLAGQTAEEASKLRYGGLAAQQITASAANGVSVDSGSVKAAVQSTQEIGGLDAAMIHYNALKEAYGLEAQSQVDKTVARNSLVSGGLKAATSFLSGATSLSDKWLQYQRSGALAGA